MEIEEVVLGRRSIRAFRPETVPDSVLRDLVELARWAPSAANTQPWEFTVVGGDNLQTLRASLRRAAAMDPVGKPEIGFPPLLPEPFSRRRREAGASVLHALGIGAEDAAKKREWFLYGIGFFNAPQVLVLSIDRRLSELAVLDVGAIAMSLMLLAHAKGIGTCPQTGPLRYPRLFHQVLGISEGNRILLTMSVGYPDSDAPVNRFDRTRVTLDECLTWSGE